MVLFFFASQNCIEETNVCSAFDLLRYIPSRCDASAWSSSQSTCSIFDISAFCSKFNSGIECSFCSSLALFGLQNSAIARACFFPCLVNMYLRKLSVLFLAHFENIYYRGAWLSFLQIYSLDILISTRNSIREFYVLLSPSNLQNTMFHK